MVDMLQLDIVSNYADTCQSGSHYPLKVFADATLQALGLNHFPT